MPQSLDTIDFLKAQRRRSHSARRRSGSSWRCWRRSWGRRGRRERSRKRRMHLRGKRIGYDRARKCLKPGRSKGQNLFLVVSLVQSIVTMRVNSAGISCNQCIISFHPLFLIAWMYSYRDISGFSCLIHVARRRSSSRLPSLYFSLYGKPFWVLIFPHVIEIFHDGFLYSYIQRDPGTYHHTYSNEFRLELFKHFLDFYCIFSGKLRFLRNNSDQNLLCTVS